MFFVGEVVKPSGKGRTASWEGMVGTVTRVEGQSVFVQGVTNCPAFLVTVFPSRANWILMILHTTRRVRLALMTLAIAIPVICLAATPQSAVDELLAADRAFSAASARTDVIAGLSPMFAADVMMPTPAGQFADGKSAVVAALRANADNARSRIEWTPVRGGISVGGQHGSPSAS